MTLREVDALIAEKVMGWELHDIDDDCPWWHSGGEAIAHKANFLPTTDAESSRFLRTRLGRQYRWLLGYGSLTEGELPFGIGLYKKDTDEVIELFMAEANTEEMAVALVALKSVGIEVEITEAQ